MTTCATSRSMFTRSRALLLAALCMFACLPTAVSAQSAKDLYETRCASCHGNIAQGSNVAPSLLGTPAVKIHFMLDTGRMPAEAPGVQETHKAPALTERQIDELTSYVADLAESADRSLPEVVPGDADRGLALYAANCQQCHGAGATGGAIGGGEYRVAPSLMQATVFQVGEAVRSGPGVMPVFGPGVLSDQDVNDIARYVNVLQTQPADPGEINLANVGPSAEGLIAWIFGIGLLIGLTRMLGTSR